MGLDDKIENAAEDAEGNVKRATGKATDDGELEAEGDKDQTKASFKKAGKTSRTPSKASRLKSVPPKTLARGHIWVSKTCHEAKSGEPPRIGYLTHMDKSVGSRRTVLLKERML